MKKSIFFLAASAIMFAMGSCTNDVLDNVQQVDSSLPQTRATASNDWTRSEERRVGKECTSWCRSRWSPYH